MADRLCSADGTPLAASSVASAGRLGYGQWPDILVGTPGGVVNALYDMEPSSRTSWLRAVKHVVIDEADLLFSGGYLSPMNKLLGVSGCDHMLHARPSVGSGLGGPGC
ncbi:unnamed protein product [Ostreobium quekettii]|uniref:DEAD/DEAH-box helicase domain-containing protein n=1 Tax=Ostreobium quekettii TaxID=121088 RepID=A0A8S1JBX1_9CHLO|nr:unnamed protein product [Ostreobium quekettii]|eukprot:evm.model.scf_2928.3 EVM.evm.TU.scf_2928.3   scf_2928:8175-8498(-)